nr:MAG TPA: hypothetical protein [Caudoviricetes sp.]DAW78044.1 MAG TPA: hypothetical protein [Caudoviricetes sp.]
MIFPNFPQIKLGDWVKNLGILPIFGHFPQL